MPDTRNSNKKSYADQLPKRSKTTVTFVISFSCAIISGLASINTFFPSLLNISQAYSPLVNSAFIIFMLVLSIGYLTYREITSKHRFSEYVIFSHYINHIFRDFMVDENASRDLHELINDICDKAAEAFSITTGKKCYCVVKTINSKDSKVKESYADNMTLSGNWDANAYDAKSWTSISSLIDGNSPRYYLCDDVIQAHKDRKYENPKLKDHKFDRALSFRKNWPLNYRSTLVLPIRYLAADTSEPDGMDGHRYFGFLCIECNSTRIFDHRYHPEMAAAIADLIYVALASYNTDETLNASKGAPKSEGNRAIID